MNELHRNILHLNVNFMCSTLTQQTQRDRIDQVLRFPLLCWYSRQQSVNISTIGLVCIQCIDVSLYFPAGGDGCFAVEKKTGQVVTTGLVLQRDREYLLSVVALDGLGSRSAPAMLSVVAGARAPQFTNASYAISIPENTPEGQPWVPCSRRSPTHT